MSRNPALPLRCLLGEYPLCVSEVIPRGYLDVSVLAGDDLNSAAVVLHCRGVIRKGQAICRCPPVCLKYSGTEKDLWGLHGHEVIPLEGLDRVAIDYLLDGVLDCHGTYKAIAPTKTGNAVRQERIRNHGTCGIVDKHHRRSPRGLPTNKPQGTIDRVLTPHTTGGQTFDLRYRKPLYKLTGVLRVTILDDGDDLVYLLTQLKPLQRPGKDRNPQQVIKYLIALRTKSPARTCRRHYCNRHFVHKISSLYFMVPIFIDLGLSIMWSRGGGSAPFVLQDTADIFGVGV
ncbi:hypothetical protein MBAV_001842 [Candidatus Magnetobacterium bavaricum]|uniref:Uncharacterized protein n=1 Tax=Candidatus Magnetobacterium bavaricum TaxID=29290 RepID=A0A0F3GVP2_9BACT|nr:hypothetical protein MBAV_001842 [Candidatus Magnetobacterium bavaricum]